MKRRLFVLFIVTLACLAGLAFFVFQPPAQAQQPSANTVIVRQPTGLIMPPGTEPVPTERGLTFYGTKTYREHTLALAPDFLSAVDGTPPDRLHLELIIKDEGNGRRVLTFNVFADGIPAGPGWSAGGRWPDSEVPGDRVFLEPHLRVNGMIVVPPDRQMIVRFNPATRTLYPAQIGTGEPGVTYAIRKRTAVENNVPTTRYFISP